MLSMGDWLQNVIDFEINLATGLGGLAAAIGLFALSQVALVGVIVAIPADFFCRHALVAPVSRRGIPALRWTIKIVKNILGVVTILLGLPLILPGIPGPGLVLMIVGIALLDFPGKRQLLYRLISHPRVFRSINSLRSRFGRPEMILCKPAVALAVATDS
jgi:hypothetical protein